MRKNNLSFNKNPTHNNESNRVDLSSKMMAQENDKVVNLESIRKKKKCKIDRRSLVTSSLFEALENEHFEVYYQPQIDLRTKKIIGAEALLRWNHAKLGFISPEEFIPLVEKNGLINALTEWVLYRACCQSKQFSILAGNPFHVSVNLSPYQLKSNNLVTKIREILTKLDFNPQLLTLELVETSVIKDLEQATRVINQLKELGISIALDDFGSGYASLSYLQNLPVDVLKLDKSLITSISDKKKTQVIVKGIIRIAKSLSMKVMAEGIETINDLDFVTEELCDVAQGYFFSAPIPPFLFIEKMYGKIKSIELERP